MRYGLTVDTAPECEPVTAEEAKTHLRVEIDADNTYIEALVIACRMRVEEHLQRKLITQTLKMSFDQFPGSHFDGTQHHDVHLGFGSHAVFRLPRSPVQSVTSIKYIDDLGVQITLAANKYRVDIESLVPRITPAFGEVWPTTRLITNAVEVLFVAGYGDDSAAIPAPIIHAIKLLIGTYYDPVRATVIVGQASKLPDAADSLLGPFRVSTRAGAN